MRSIFAIIFVLTVAKSMAKPPATPVNTVCEDHGVECWEVSREQCAKHPDLAEYCPLTCGRCKDETGVDPVCWEFCREEAGCIVQHDFCDTKGKLSSKDACEAYGDVETIWCPLTYGRSKDENEKLQAGEYCEPNLGKACGEGLICENPKKHGLDVNSCAPNLCKCAKRAMVAIVMPPPGVMHVPPPGVMPPTPVGQQPEVDLVCWEFCREEAGCIVQHDFCDTKGKLSIKDTCEAYPDVETIWCPRPSL